VTRRLLFAPACALICLWAAGAARAGDPADDLLRNAAAHGMSVHTLFARFTQEKTLQMLVAPLRSSGYFCLSGKGGGDRVVWVYETPVRSGFTYESGKGSFWSKDPTNIRPVSAQEGAALSAMVRSLLTWVRIEPQRLREEHVVSMPDPAVPSLCLRPRKPNSFFSEVLIRFAPSLRTVESLRFTDADGGGVTLSFTDVRLNSLLPALCDP
jgi:hypothetical protein